MPFPEWWRWLLSPLCKSRTLFGCLSLCCCVVLHNGEASSITQIQVVTLGGRELTHQEPEYQTFKELITSGFRNEKDTLAEPIWIATGLTTT
jgi:hypothetical protein